MDFKRKQVLYIVSSFEGYISKVHSAMQRERNEGITTLIKMGARVYDTSYIDTDSDEEALKHTVTLLTTSDVVVLGPGWEMDVLCNVIAEASLLFDLPVYNYADLIDELGE